MQLVKADKMAIKVEPKKAWSWKSEAMRPPPPKADQDEKLVGYNAGGVGVWMGWELGFWGAGSWGWEEVGVGGGGRWSLEGLGVGIGKKWGMVTGWGGSLGLEGVGDLKFRTQWRGWQWLCSCETNRPWLAMWLIATDHNEAYTFIAHK